MPTASRRAWPQSTMAVGPRCPRSRAAGAPFLDRALRGGQADALRAPAELEVLEALEGDGQVRAALVARQGVDLVDDHRGHAAEHGPAALGGDHEVEALGRGHQERRRGLDHGGPGPGRGVAGADGHGHRGTARPSSRATSAISASGRSRFWWMSTARALRGET